jgi:16S rRNA processing protein RimM
LAGYPEVKRLVEYLAVGKIVNTHGVHGEMKVLPLTTDISRFDYLKIVWVENNGGLTEHFVKKVRYHKNFVLITLSGIDTLEKASEYKNCYIKVNREYARPLEEDEYFIADLLDCDVYQEAVFLGKVTDVLQTAGNDVYVVSGDKYGEILIPAIVSVVLDVDIEGKRILVKLPEGLVENNDL